MSQCLMTTVNDFDPNCDPNNPRKVSVEECQNALALVRETIKETPCTKSLFSEPLGMNIYLKREIQNHTGSFKERGAVTYMKMLPQEKKQKGVIAVSLGNHAQGCSYHGTLLGIPTTVVMPTSSPIMKITKCRNYGANVVLKGKDMGESKTIALEMAKEHGVTYINNDHPNIIAGQSSIGFEILEQVPNVDAIIVPVGSGGLVAGIASIVKHKKPDTLIYGVESDNCAAMTAAFKNKKPTLVSITSTVADGLAVPMVGSNCYFILSELMDKMISLNEDFIALAILRMMEIEKVVVEGAGATPLAAILAGKCPELKGKTVVLVLSGGNIDSSVLGRCIERGLAVDGRLLKFCVLISDRPGGLNELTTQLAELQSSIKNISYDRAYIHDIFGVQMYVMVECSSQEHNDTIRAKLSERYGNDITYYKA